MKIEWVHNVDFNVHKTDDLFGRGVYQLHV